MSQRFCISCANALPFFSGPSLSHSHLYSLCFDLIMNATEQDTLNFFFQTIPIGDFPPPRGELGSRLVFYFLFCRDSSICLCVCVCVCLCVCLYIYNHVHDVHDFKTIYNIYMHICTMDDGCCNCTFRNMRMMMR